MAKTVNVSPSASLSQWFHGLQIQNSIYLDSTCKSEILEIIGYLNPNKVPGIDEVPTKLIKAAKYSLVAYLTKIFNHCLDKSQYPDILKVAKVTPLHKEGSKSEPKNYRLISVLTVLNKILETIIKRRLINFGNKYVFASTQFWFRENYSTNLAITHLHQHIIDNLDNHLNVCSIFMDLAKAFDTVNHGILLYKLE